MPRFVAQIGVSDFPAASTQEPDTPSAIRTAQQSRMPTIRPIGYELQPGEDPENRLVSPFLKHIVAIKSSSGPVPHAFAQKISKWILPAAGITAAFIASDSWWSQQVNPNHVQTSLTYFRLRHVFPDWSGWSFIPFWFHDP